MTFDRALAIGLVLCAFAFAGISIASWFTDVEPPSVGLLWIGLALVFWHQAKAEIR